MAGSASKLHVGVDETTGELVAAPLTTVSVSDSEVLPHFVEQADGPPSRRSRATEP